MLLLLYLPAAMAQSRPIDQAWDRHQRNNSAMNDNAPLQTHPSVDLSELKREAEELAKLSQSLPPDIEALSKGLLPKDLNDKLKRIEKLSKKLRSQLVPPVN